MKDSGIAAEIEAPRRHIIERPRLTRLLDEADARILMLVAPAGYGKTTLARQWVETAGRLIYGEILEPGQSALAMNHDEAFAVLKQRGGEERSGLVALADGWPAIIGLAAEADTSAFREAVVPESLFEFFAEELFQAAAATV